MKQVIYIDELLFLNIVVNYFLLLTTSMLTKSQVNKFRILLGSFIGGLFSFTVFLPPLGFFLSLSLRIVVALILSFVTFGFKSISLFLKHCITLFLSTALFAGIISAIWLTFRAQSAVYINSAIYFDVNIFVLIFSVAGCYIMIYFFKKLFKRNLPYELTCEISIEVFGRNVVGKGMLDTGNSLREAFSSFPVAISTKRFCSPLLPKDLTEKYEQTNFDEVEENWKKRLRIISCSTVSGTGTMLAFRPDRITVKTYKRTFQTERVYIAISKRENYLNEKFDVILPSEIFEGEENE